MTEQESDFVPFSSIPRLAREVVVTEKIDGTNGQVVIGEDGSVRAGSRNRWIVPGDDNGGFAAWVAQHADGLRALGVGRHFGEWWGAGIQRRYGLTEKRFSLFNTGRWRNQGDMVADGDVRVVPPACCHVVPVLWRGTFDTRDIETTALDRLRHEGSVAAPGFMEPEGIVIYHVAANCYFKKTIEKDAAGKGQPR